MSHRSLFESYVRENSINTHDKFDEKLKNDFVKKTKYIDKMQAKFDEVNTRLQTSQR